MHLEEAYSILGYKDSSALEEGWRTAQRYDAFDAEKFNKRILSSLDAIDADLTPVDGLYVCPFCDKISFRPQRRGEEVVLACSSCRSTIALNPEVWEDPRRRIEYLSFTSGYPGVYILHHILVLHEKNRAQPGISGAESKDVEKAVASLSSPDEEVRYRAARYLRIRRPPQAFTSAVAALSSEPAAKIRVMLVQALPSIGGRDAIPHLIAASEDADPAVRGAALHALSSFGGAVVDEVTGRTGGVR
ncbi:MAG TPA: HEAT repeat domain-containing protein [Methanofollis liminatans]|mgnify:CR=1 FL=1|uniref:HEAT repeat domain-containing protein n=1 Tax=Methanofollis liminatans TaxID=2201 RepID=A0A831PS20_9EURY|nr:HEAT repeat domain-containing protein [Methanofollis liminatans]